MTVPALDFRILGQPVPKGRPRLGRKQTYTPARTRAYGGSVATQTRAAMRYAKLRGAAAGLPVAIELDIVFQRRSDLFRRADPDGRIPKATRPDLDNVAKSVMDGLQVAELFVDDGQVAVLVVRKWWGEVLNRQRRLSEPAHVRVRYSIIGASPA